MSKQKLISKSRTKQKEKETVTNNKPKLPLEINLNEIINPNPAIKKAYSDADALDQFYPEWNDRAEYKNEKRIFDTAQATKGKISHRIISIYRKKTFSAGEKVFFMEHLWTKNLMNNVIDHTRTCGRWEQPIVDVQNGLIEVHNGESQIGPAQISISRVETRYSYDWEKIKPQLLRWSEEGIIDEKVNLTVITTGNKKYHIESWDDFINYSIDELVSLSRFGAVIRPEEIKMIMEQKGKEKAAQMMLNRID